MNSSIANTLHTLLIGGQLVNLEAIPQEYRIWVAIGLGLAQGVIAWFQHRYNIDGTPQAAAYKPKN